MPFSLGQLAYDYGEAPLCNAVDRTDLALPGFIRNLNPETRNRRVIAAKALQFAPVDVR